MRKLRILPVSPIDTTIVAEEATKSAQLKQQLLELKTIHSGSENYAAAPSSHFWSATLFSKAPV